MPAKRNLVVLADGTGNSAAKAFKTNVWRLYQALDLTDGSQLAVFGDGVGTSSFKPAQLLGLALGIGVKRNVLNLYKFLCRNYNDGDRLWAFGFSRGAFTVRVLAGLIHHEGLVSFRSEEELDRNAIAAYRAYRAKSFATKLPWVRWGRACRDLLVVGGNKITGARTYKEIKKETLERDRNIVTLHFIGVWDTVAAYGLPVDELTQAVDKWVWPMSFRDTSLLINVENARHALSLDDERRTFFPIPWNETDERTLRSLDPTIKPDRLLQVWFAGVHANVGGGYPDDSLAHVPLCWMIEEAVKKGLRFKPWVVTSYTAVASPTGRAYDSRARYGIFYRYRPRDAQALMGKENRPLVHHSVVMRMAQGNDGYAPISVPHEIDVLPPYGGRIKFDTATAAKRAQLQPPSDLPILPGRDPAYPLNEMGALLDNIDMLNQAAGAQDRAPLVALVQDTVWWRQLIYFALLGFGIAAVALPILQRYFGNNGTIDSINVTTGGILGWAIDLIKGYFPAFAEPWLAAVVAKPVTAAVVLSGLGISFALSNFLRRRILDRARAAWRVQAQADGMMLDRLRLSGQRRAAAKAALIFGILSVLAVIQDIALIQEMEKLQGNSLVQQMQMLQMSKSGDLPILENIKSESNKYTALAVAFGAISLVSTMFFLWRTRNDPGEIDAVKPGLLLGFARRLRLSPAIVSCYRLFAHTVVPGLFLLTCILVIISFTHRALFDGMNAIGHYCSASSTLDDRQLKKMFLLGSNLINNEGIGGGLSEEKLGVGAVFTTSKMCHATGLTLIEGGQYRITLTMQDDWFDKRTRTDVAGFSAESAMRFIATPLKRWWAKNWFQPIARVGELGNYEYALEPAAPLPNVPFAQCRPIDARQLSMTEALRDIPNPISAEQRDQQIACEKTLGLHPSRVLISDIRAGTTGELFVYVNDAVMPWPGLTNIFYLNNSGTAIVEVERIRASAIVKDE